MKTEIYNGVENVPLRRLFFSFKSSYYNRFSYNLRKDKLY